MKVWSCVELFGGVMTDMRVFPTMEMARKHFHDFVNENGSVEDCDPDFYNDGENEYFYWDDGFHNDNEIHIWPVTMETEGYNMEIKIGNNAIFNTYGSDSTWCERDGEVCKVLRHLTDEEADLFDVGMMYKVRFNDGVETDAFEDELEPMKMEV